MAWNISGPKSFARGAMQVVNTAPGPTRTARNVLPRYLLAAALARLADDGVRVAFILLALERGAGAAFGGLVVAALLIPHVVAAPAVGILADRVRARRAFYAAALATYGGILALCGVLVGRVPAPVVLLIAAAGGCIGPLITGGLTALLGDLVPAAQLERAYSLDVASYTVAGIGGPALTALLAATLGPVAATFALAVSVCAGALLLGALPIPRRDRGPDRAHPPMTRGIAVLWRDRTLRATTLASSLGQIGAGALPLAAALLASRYHAAAAGALLAAYAVGTLLGSLGYARRPIGTTAPEWLVVGCLLAAALPLAIVPWVSNFVLAIALFAAAGSFSGPGGSALFVVRERQAPAEVRTQVFTLAAGLKITAAALGAGLAGFGAWLGGDTLLLAIAACFVLAAGTGIVLLRRR